MTNRFSQFKRAHLSVGASALALSLAFATPTEGRDLAFGLSSNQTPEAVRAQVEQALLFAATELEPSETALFFDAGRVRLLGEFRAPEGRAKSNVRARLQANRAVVGALKGFINGAEAVPGQIGVSDWPGLLQLLRTGYETDTDRALIMLGSSIFNEPEAPSISMVGGRVPNDGHIAAVQGQSPYATSGLSGSLDGYDVYVGLVGDDWEVSEAHGYHVQRFWTLNAEGHGATMSYFGDDLATLYRLVAEGPSEDAHNHADPLMETDKLEMLSFAPDNGTLPPLYAAPLNEEPAPEPIWQSAQPVNVGVTWDQSGVDVDLYVRPKPDAEVIYYGNADTAAGRLFKDYTVSPGVGFETVALNGRIDLSKTQIALNYYGGPGQPSGVTGELRIAIGDEVWAAPFEISATEGNRGAGAETALVDQVVPNVAWVLVDPMKVIGAR